MDNLFIEKTKYTPKIELDKSGKVLIEGRSYPENSFEFYKVVIDWIKEFIHQEECHKLDIYIHLSYFNSTTSQVLFEMFDMIEEYQKKCEKYVKVYWLYDEDNDAALEAGEDFKDDFENIDIELVEVKAD